MEDSFRARVNKAFGSLDSLYLSTEPSSLTSLWSLTDNAIDKREWKRSKRSPESDPYPSFCDNLANGFNGSSSGFRDDLEKNLEDIDDDEDDAPRSPGPSKPDDYDDEQWEIKSGIGRDCTLDYEEEEDQYDKQAIGKLKSGDRLYMKDVSDDGIDMDSCNVLPTSFRDFVRDPRANHFAAKVRLKEDDAAATEIDNLHVSQKSASDNGGSARGNQSYEDGVKLKSILKSNENNSEPKNRKRVRFDSEYDDRCNNESEGARAVHMKTSSMEEATSSNQSKEFASEVPDYIRNPSRYVKYTFDSSSDMDDESNKQAYMDFLSHIKKSSGVAGSPVDDAFDDLPSVTFISKKKSGDAPMVENRVVSKQSLDVGKVVHRQALPVGIAAVDAENSDLCAMEEDEAEVNEDMKSSSQKLNRQYRRKTQESDEHMV